MREVDSIDLSDYLTQHYEELHAYLCGLFGSHRFAKEVCQDLLFYLWNRPAQVVGGNPMGLLLAMGNRLGQYRRRQAASPILRINAQISPETKAHRVQEQRVR